MAKPDNPTIRRRRLSGELKRLREASGMTSVAVAERMGWNRTKVHRIEGGNWKRLNPQDIRALAELYGVTETRQRDALVALAKEAKHQGWWAAYDEFFGAGTYIGLEAAASFVRTYESLNIPGLLQTPSYAEAVIASVFDDPGVVERRVEARLARQKILTDENPVKLWAVIDEAALVRQVGSPAVRREQFAHLVEVSRAENINIQILPLSAGAHAAMGGQFVILDFPGNDPSVVYVETNIDGLFLERPDEIDRYVILYGRVQGKALGVEESRTFLSKLIEQVAE